MKDLYTTVTARLTLGAFCMLFLLFGCAAPEPEPLHEAVMQAPDDGVNAISNISTEALVGKMRITLHANQELTYTAFKLNDPLRLVLDLPNVDTSQVSELTFPNQEPLLRVTPFQFSEGDTTNSRVEVALTRLVPYQVFNDANKLFIDLEVPVDDSQTAMSPAAGSTLPPGFEELDTVQAAEPLTIDASPPQAAEAGSMATASATGPAAGTSAQIPPGLPTIAIAPPPDTVGDVATLSQVLASPSSIALLEGVEVSEVDGKTRIVIKADKTPEFDVKRTDVPPRLTIDLQQSDLPPGAEQVVTPEALDTLVKQVRMFQLRRTPGGTDNVARVLVDLMQPTDHHVSTQPGQVVIDIDHPAVQLADAPELEGDDIVEVPLTTGIEEALSAESEPEEAEIAAAPSIRAPKTGDEKEYKGQLISIHFQQADILDVLDVIAEVSGLNLVVHPGVGGTVTVRLENIPWDQALDIILKMNNLALEIEGNILRIAQASVFQQEIAQRINMERQQIEALQVQEDLQPLETKLITVNFAEPGAIVGIINSYFTGANVQNNQQRRGTITVDPRTKTLIIQDTAANIEKIEEIVATLDRRTPQVLIEARIVSLSTTFRKELGINWSGRFNADPAHGNPLGYRFPYTIDVPSFGVSLPQVGSPVGSIGPVTLGSIDDVITIFARIDAAEENYKAKTLAQPKIFTQDNVGASVTSTQTQYVAVRGDSQTAASIQPVSAALSLNVTPRISRDGFITMQVNVTNGAVGTGAGGGATTDTQAVNSQVTVKDGETVVIGGIYGTSDVENLTAVPYLHKIPIIGRLFKSTLPNSKSQSELLVFLTPRILDRSILKPEEGAASAAFSY